MHTEAQEELAKGEAEFKNMIFANNPKLYEVIFGDDVPDEEEFINDDDFEWVVPQTEGDVAKMMADLDAVWSA